MCFKATVHHIKNCNIQKVLIQRKFIEIFDIEMVITINSSSEFYKVYKLLTENEIFQVHLHNTFYLTFFTVLTIVAKNCEKRNKRNYFIKVFFLSTPSKLIASF